MALIDWLSQQVNSTTSEYHFVMEATGVYHEKCADWVFNTGSKVSVYNSPNYMIFTLPLSMI